MSQAKKSIIVAYQIDDKGNMVSGVEVWNNLKAFCDTYEFAYGTLSHKGASFDFRGWKIEKKEIQGIVERAKRK
ncbi:hypothetical protein [Carboxylicivirga sp. RSCT41]|uniref:hypothetical protein n=1 Tax=Carboxylicivirga agarovorans TaxID=3417570 RepID=UPI003D32C531